MLGDYCWTVVRDALGVEYKCQAKRKRIALSNIILGGILKTIRPMQIPKSLIFQFKILSA